MKVKTGMIDPRVGSEEKLLPPPPLPFVSRRALARVKDPLPPPTECRYCGGRVELINNRVIYKREFGQWPYLYHCWPCDAYVGLHPETDLPLGTLATCQLRGLRMNNKALFLKMMFNKGWKFDTAYAWLAEQMQIPLDKCHWGMFDEEQCVLAGELCEVRE